MKLIIKQDLIGISHAVTRLYSQLNGNLEPVMSDIAGIIERNTRQRFSTQMDPEGHAWAQLMPSTLKAKKGKGSILIHHRTLVDSLTSFATQTTATVGTGQMYGRFHQEGTSKMVARPIFGISYEDERDINEKLAEWLSDLMAGERP